MSKRETLRSAGSVYIENLVLLGAGYIFWFILARITTTEVVGTSSALISMAVILSVVAAIGIPSGLQRHIGRTYLHGKIADTKVYVAVSLLLTAAGILISILITLLAYQWILGSNVEPNLVYITTILIASTSLTSLFRSVVISSLSKSAWLPVAATISTIAKISIGISLVIVGLGSVGIMIGFTLAPLITVIILGFVILKLFKSRESKREVHFQSCVKDIISASIPTWIPLIVNTVGSHLGTIVVYGSHGAEQAALYYISLSLIVALITLTSALYTVSIPVLSAMNDGRKRLTWRTIKMTLVLSSPVSIALLFYPHEILSIFGPDYEKGGLALGILLLSIFPTVVSMGISALVYAYGKYRDVLIIGLASNIPRPLLYIVLVPFFDSTGAAISYTLGSVIGLLFSIAICRKIGMKIFWKEVILMLVVPATILMGFKFMNINFVIAIVVTIILSPIIFLRLKILTRPDIKDSLMTLPDGISKPLLSLLSTVAKIRNK